MLVPRETSEYFDAAHTSLVLIVFVRCEFYYCLMLKTFPYNIFSCRLLKMGTVDSRNIKYLFNNAVVLFTSRIVLRKLGEDSKAVYIKVRKTSMKEVKIIVCVQKLICIVLVVHKKNSFQGIAICRISRFQPQLLKIFIH